MSEFLIELHTGARDVSGFDCGNQDLTDWLLRHAPASHRADLARTYLALDGDVVAGYFSITTGSIRPEEAPKRLARGMPATPSAPSSSRDSPSTTATSVNASEADSSPRHSAERSPPATLQLLASWSSTRSMTEPSPSIEDGDSSMHLTTLAASTAR